jgi:hypothetical protein
MRYFGSSSIFSSSRNGCSTHVSLDLFNIFNANVADVTYYYNSWLPTLRSVSIRHRCAPRA